MRLLLLESCLLAVVDVFVVLPLPAEELDLLAPACGLPALEARKNQCEDEVGGRPGLEGEAVIGAFVRVAESCAAIEDIEEWGRRVHWVSLSCESIISEGVVLVPLFLFTPHLFTLPILLSSVAPFVGVAGTGSGAEYVGTGAALPTPTATSCTTSVSSSSSTEETSDIGVVALLLVILAATALPEDVGGPSPGLGGRCGSLA
ncbi:hypothetical protein BDZ97DRAFT_1814077 [Flammula alnicola]|nr:hypothetical protein BDZ97DRAFT_1814077 [Flammula alnicola]